MTIEQQYIASLDIEASYNLAKQMEAYRTNPVLGYRPAGSKAEFETGEMLKSYMEDLGLSNVRKDEIKVDGWEFEKAVLAYADAAGERKEVQRLCWRRSTREMNGGLIFRCIRPMRKGQRR